MTISDAGMSLVKESEGLSLHVYRDAAGVPTIGYGHALLAGESFPQGITEEQGDSMLRADLAKAEAAVNDLVKVPLNQHQFDALVDFTYNLGVDAFRGSTLLACLNNREYDVVPGQIRRWVYAAGRELPGLVARREREAELWLQE